MKRKLAWACGILVVLALAVRRPSESPSRTGATSVAPVRTGPSVESNSPRSEEGRGDPLVGNPRAESRERQVRARAEAERLRARQVQVAAQQERIFEEHRARLIEAGFDPGLPDPGRAWLLR